MELVVEQLYVRLVDCVHHLLEEAGAEDEMNLKDHLMVVEEVMMMVPLVVEDISRTKSCLLH